MVRGGGGPSVARKEMLSAVGGPPWTNLSVAAVHGPGRPSAGPFHGLAASVAKYIHDIYIVRALTMALTTLRAYSVTPILPHYHYEC